MIGSLYLGYRPDKQRVQEEANKLLKEGYTKIIINWDGSISFGGSTKEHKYDNGDIVYEWIQEGDIE
jgi:hypothetical protein